jgi:hypothetical protein
MKTETILCFMVPSYAIERKDELAGCDAPPLGALENKVVYIIEEAEGNR